MQAMFPIPEPSEVTGLILAGGKARRLNGVDKGLITLGNQQLVEHAITRLGPQLGAILINANRNHEDYRRLGHPIVADTVPDFAGPLAGLLTGLQHIKGDWLVSVPCDNPWLPADLVTRLLAGIRQQACPLAVARCDGRLQGVYCLAHRSLQGSLAAYLAEGQHRVQDWIGQQSHIVVEFSDAREFENINTPQQLAEAQKGL